MIGELSVVTAPSGEPVTLTEAKAHLRAGDDEDTLIYGLIATAREVCEPKAGRAFLTQTLKMVYPCWPTGQRPYFELLRGPIQSISSVKYYDTSNTLQTMPATDYFADLTVAPARIWLGDGKMWPSASLRLGAAVEVTYVAGYSAASAVPRSSACRPPTIPTTPCASADADCISSTISPAGLRSDAACSGAQPRRPFARRLSCPQKPQDRTRMAKHCSISRITGR